MTEVRDDNISIIIFYCFNLSVGTTPNLVMPGPVNPRSKTA